MSSFNDFLDWTGDNNVSSSACQSGKEKEARAERDDAPIDYGMRLVSRAILALATEGYDEDEEVATI